MLVRSRRWYCQIRARMGMMLADSIKGSQSLAEMVESGKRNLHAGATSGASPRGDSVTEEGSARGKVVIPGVMTKPQPGHLRGCFEQRRTRLYSFQEFSALS